MRCIDLTQIPEARRTRARRRRSRLQALMILLGVLSVFFFVAAVRAQEAPGPRLTLPTRAPSTCQRLEAAVEGVEGEPTRVTHAGIAGMWFPMAIARLQLCEVLELRVRKAELAVVDQELTLWNHQATNFETQAALAVEARDAFAGVVGASERRASDAEARLDAWYRHPALWFTIGAVIVGALLAAAVAVLNTLKISPI